jgi:Tol biopolymer transport system component
MVQKSLRRLVSGIVLVLVLASTLLGSCTGTGGTSNKPGSSTVLAKGGAAPVVTQLSTSFSSGIVDIMLARPDGEPFFVSKAGASQKLTFRLKIFKDLQITGGAANDPFILQRGGTPVSGPEGDSALTGNLGICGGYALRELLKKSGNITPQAGWGIDPDEVYNKLYDAGLISPVTKAGAYDLVFWFPPNSKSQHAAIIQSVNPIVVRNKDEKSMVFTASIDAKYFTETLWHNAHGDPQLFHVTEDKILMLVDTSKSGDKTDAYLQNLKVIVKVPDIPNNAKSIMITAVGDGFLANKPFRKAFPISKQVEQEFILPMGYKMIRAEMKNVSAADAEKFDSGTSILPMTESVVLKDEHFFSPIQITFTLEAPKTNSTATYPGKLYLGATPYQQEDKMNHGLFEINPSTGANRRLTVRATDGVGVSPDGNMVASGMLEEKTITAGDPQLAFYNLADESKSIPSVFILRPDDNGPLQLTGPAWSPDGKLMVVSNTGDLYLYSLDKKAGSRRIMSGWDAAWSPVDNRLVVGGNQGLIMVDDVTNIVDPWYDNPTLVGNAFNGSAVYMSGTPTDAKSPEWSPDAQNIVFVSAKGIWVLSAGGGTPKRLTPDTWKTAAPVYSPEGKYIAFVRTDTGADSGVWIMNADGGNPKQVLKTNLSNIWHVDLDWALAPGEKAVITTTTRTTTTTTSTPTTTTTTSTTTSTITTSTTTSTTSTTSTSTPPAAVNTITGFRLYLVKIGEGDNPGTSAYEIYAEVTATIKDPDGAMANVTTNVNSIPVGTAMHYPGETVTIVIAREDLEPGQVVTATCKLSPNGNTMTASVTAP